MKLYIVSIAHTALISWTKTIHISKLLLRRLTCDLHGEEDERKFNKTFSESPEYEQNPQRLSQLSGSLLAAHPPPSTELLLNNLQSKQGGGGLEFAVAWQPLSA